MAYMGSISYFDVAMGDVDWADLDLPFEPISYHGAPRDFIIASTMEFDKEKIADTFYDLPGSADRSDQACVGSHWDGEA